MCRALIEDIKTQFNSVCLKYSSFPLNLHLGLSLAHAIYIYMSSQLKFLWVCLFTIAFDTSRQRSFQEICRAQFKEKSAKLNKFLILDPAPDDNLLFICRNFCVNKKLVHHILLSRRVQFLMEKCSKIYSEWWVIYWFCYMVRNQAIR